MFNNPLRMSKTRAFCYLLVSLVCWWFFAWVTSRIPNTVVFAQAAAFFVLFFASLFAYKMWRDLRAANGHRVQSYTSSPTRSTITEKTSEGTDILEVPSQLSRDH